MISYNSHGSHGSIDRSKGSHEETAATCVEISCMCRQCKLYTCIYILYMLYAGPIGRICNDLRRSVSFASCKVYA